MSLCDACRSPGSCCQGLVINRTYPADRWKELARQDVINHKHEFLHPVRREAIPRADGSVGVMFDCDRLDANGRCSDYENRPYMCQQFQPGQDPLCTEFTQKLRGIPIRVI